MRKMLMPLLLIAAFQACTSDKKDPKAVPSFDVNVVPVGTKTVPVFKEYVGQTYGKSDVSIQSRVDGWITGIHFKEGDYVKQGQLLYTIDDQPIQNKIEAASARLAQANTQLVRTKADLDRVQPLADMNALSKRDLDAAKAAYNAAKEEVNIAQAGLQNSKLELSYTRITAPISGIIGLSKMQVGDYVGKLGSAPLNTVSSTDRVRVRFSVSETEFLTYLKAVSEKKSGELSPNMPVSLLLSDGTVYDEPGSIDLANREIDPQTGSIIVQALFSNTKAILRPGQYVKLKVKTGEYADALLVPQQAVNQLQNIYQVFVLNDSSKLTPTIIQVGERVGSNWIIKSGITAQTKVAVIGSAVIKPNTPVKPVMMRWSYDSTSN
ncbi:MAG: efflux RND transporter periplasmic adaptor subunit [Chitinophagales bacterium]|jgi:membrane fusion protein (multidrug efflux system)|nr:efflux RND transporter periplasmic adaptor subunit [Chitinophagales bacterium]